MNRVIVTRPMMGLLAMQVCAVEDATDKEILEVCNLENLCGTTNGWCRVIREGDGEEDKHGYPVRCEQEPGRWHYICTC